jgi:hypothetical protein
MMRYEVSARFRRMLLILTWLWDLGFISIAIVETVLVMVLTEHFGVAEGQNGIEHEGSGQRGNICCLVFEESRYHQA